MREGAADSPRGRKASCGCDSGAETCSKCGKKKGRLSRSDALTPEEYLAASQLGIQQKSRTYIRARLDAAVSARAGKKCGNSTISANKKCNKGAGGAAAAPASQSAGMSNTAQSMAKSRQSRMGRIADIVEKGAIIGGGVGTMYSYGQVINRSLKGDFTGAGRALRNEGGWAALSGAGVAARGTRLGDKKMQKEGLNTMATGAGVAAFGAYTAGDFKNMKRPNINMRGAATRAKIGMNNLKGRASAMKSNITMRSAKARLRKLYERPDS
jgi:hypothetical protein